MAKSAKKDGKKAASSAATQPAPDAPSAGGGAESSGAAGAGLATVIDSSGPTPAAGSTEATSRRDRGGAVPAAAPEIPPGFMRGTLSGSYNYGNRWYDPGEGLVFPKGLGYTLGMPGSAE